MEIRQLTYNGSKTTGGLIFTQVTASQYQNQGGNTGNTAEYNNFNILFLGGGTAGTCNQLICVWLMSGSGGTLAAYAAANGYTVATGQAYTTTQDANGGDNPDAGEVVDPNLQQMEIPNVVGSPGYLEFFVWEGTASTYASAAAKGNSGVFAQNYTTGITPGVYSTMMPDILITVPEPSTMALAGLGGKPSVP